ncbi:putative uncharacterized protein DDB_G0274435 [Limulus polyphemus]|uniref:Uncharacterized protein n=1 Tax=Limulus polyphemus TaxID=6850 RepID=A0ABM1T0Q9_LIMPO|nr:putative uncharacterized protein DDB_G0274435 [Limulus polyphemus]
MDYDKLKMALLKRYELTKEEFLWKLREIKLDNGETENLFYFILRESVIQKMFEQRQKMEKERHYQNERIWQEKLKQGIAREKHQNKYKEPSNDLKESSDYMHKSQKPMTSNNGSPSNITKVIDKPPDAPVYQSVPDASFKEDIDFLNFLKKKREQTGKHEEDEEEEKTKEKLPPRPKPLTKKEQEAQSYRRSKEAEKLHEEIMQQQQRQLLREEKRLQKEAERRHKLNEEKLHHLQEQASLTVGKSKNRNTSTVKSSKLDEVRNGQNNK